MDIRFESPIGTPHPSLQFEQGQRVRITGTVRGSLGPSPFAPVQLVISSQAFAPMYAQATSNFWGNYWFDVDLPRVDALASVRVTASFAVGPPDSASITIGIGSAVPPPPPPPPDSPFNQFTKNLTTIVIVGLVAYAAVNSGILKRWGR